MNAKQAKHYLLSFPEEVFIKWYNDRMICRYGGDVVSKIEENTPEKFWNVVTQNLSPEVFIQVAKRSNYAETDKYFHIADKVRSFDTIEELMAGEEGAIIAFMFLEDEEVEMANLEVERANYVEK